jgi:hypothetical protein
MTTSLHELPPFVLTPATDPQEAAEWPHWQLATHSGRDARISGERPEAAEEGSHVTVCQGFPRGKPAQPATVK